MVFFPVASVFRLLRVWVALIGGSDVRFGPVTTQNKAFYARNAAIKPGTPIRVMARLML
jgi:hypothetical protein